MEEIKNKHSSRIVIPIQLVLNGGIIFFSLIKVVTPPKHLIGGSKTDNTSSWLGNYSYRVCDQIRNDGGDGYVIFEATVHQGEKKWNKTKKRHFQTNETAEMELIFDEVKILELPPWLSDKKVYAFNKQSRTIQKRRKGGVL